jgi:hypothetical protein
MYFNTNSGILEICNSKEVHTVASLGNSTKHYAYLLSSPCFIDLYLKSVSVFERELWIYSPRLHHTTFSLSGLHARTHTHTQVWRMSSNFMHSSAIEQCEIKRVTPKYC